MKRLMALDNVGPALRGVLLRINEAAEKRPENLSHMVPRLVAVSKTKPVECILEAYKHGQRHFGENYVQELVEKANDPRLKDLSGLNWHFIGHLQRNKCNNLTGIPNLFMVETVDSERLAATLNYSWGKLKRDPLQVLVEVNTSDEESKKGCHSDECLQLTEYILHKCPHLRLSGLMTIGQYNYDWAELGPNPDFLCLIKCRELVCEKLNLPTERVELSMGMSSDFDKAVTMGSTSVRVGSIIFGSRESKLPENPTPVTNPISTREQVSMSEHLDGSVDAICADNNVVSQFNNLILG